MSKIHLRSTLRELRAIEFDHSDFANVAMAPQEMLDFLAMLDGLKPVYLLGRGFDDRNWIKGVEGVAIKKRLNVVHGAYWDAVSEYDGVPPDMAKVMAERETVRNAIYICKAPGIAKELRQIEQTGRVSIEEEAKLLGYPTCCVSDHYGRTAAMTKGVWLMLQRVGENNSDKIKRLIREDVGMTPETDEEKNLLLTATNMVTAPFTSFHMCTKCAEKADGPARTLSKKYEELAKTIDLRLWQEIAMTTNQQEN